MNQRIGLGYDIHRLVKGRRLVLGGVEIPYSKGLEGHSDADVLLHAISDAFLGALGEGDIGEMFPDTDEKYRNISSQDLLLKVYALVKEKGFCISNIDTVVVADEPKLVSFKEKIRHQIAQDLSISDDCVNIKATTTEKTGFGSAGEDAICAYAIALLTKKEL